jgi:hypothetical protein
MRKRGPSSSEQAISLGYSEGFEAGRSFAANNLSKVGFINQLIEDKLADHVANKDLEESKGDYYRSWYAKGVADAEALVVSPPVHRILFPPPFPPPLISLPSRPQAQTLTAESASSPSSDF